MPKKYIKNIGWVDFEISSDNTLKIKTEATSEDIKKMLEEIEGVSERIKTPHRPFAFPKNDFDISNAVYTGSSSDNPINVTNIGHDGRVYGQRQGKEVIRAGDKFESPADVYDFSSNLNADEYIKAVTKTFHGYVILTTDTTTETSRVFFSETFDSGYTEVLSFQNSKTEGWNTHFYVKNEAHSTLLIGCYSGVKNTPLPLYMSKDGENWDLIRETIVNNPDGNCHWHTAVYDVYDGIIWAFQGDTQNAMLHYSLDRGETWKTVENYDGTFSGREYQPTMSIAFRDRIIIGSDITEGTDAPFALWEIKKPRNFTYRSDMKIKAKQIYVVRDYYGSDDSTQYFTGPYFQDGDKVILKAGSIGSTKQSHIIGTGDGGQTWHHLAVLIGDEANQNGMIGPDKNGYAYINYIGYIGTRTIINKDFEWLYK